MRNLSTKYKVFPILRLARLQVHDRLPVPVLLLLKRDIMIADIADRVAGNGHAVRVASHVVQDLRATDKWRCWY
jgi:hypothetical protein